MAAPVGRQGQRRPGPCIDQRNRTPQADHGETSYVVHGRLAGKAAVITGGDSGIGRAAALAFAREGADVLIAYLDEHDDAHTTERLVRDAGRKAVLVPGDIADPSHCRAIVDRAVEAFGRIDVLVNNAAFQMTRQSLEEIPDEEWEHTFAVNISAMFYICKAAVKHMKPGSSIINTASINSDNPKPTLLPYATTKGAIATSRPAWHSCWPKKGYA
jgi:NAD(P)-dependent dehydrogenase (short-subunit alcohol dehydrogenase family)